MNDLPADSLQTRGAPDRAPDRAPTVSAVVPTVDSGPMLLRCLESVGSYEGIELVIVDNGSSDGSVELAESRCPDVRTVRNERNLGFARACNQGAAAATGEFLLFLNTDAFIGQADLDRLVAAAKADPGAAIWQPANYGVDGSIDFSGDHFTWWGFFFHEQEELRDTFPRPIFSAKGACVLVRRSVFESLGGMNDDYFAYFEETDLCWRARLAGWEVRLVPEARVEHIGGATTGRILTPGEIRYLSFRNRLRTILANTSPLSLLRILPRHILACTALAALYLLTGRPRSTAAIAAAVWWPVRNARNVRAQRRRVQAIRALPDREVFQRGFVTNYRPTAAWRHLRQHVYRWEHVRPQDFDTAPDESRDVAAPASLKVLRRIRNPAAASEVLERTARVTLTAAVFLVPVVLDPRTVDGFGLVKITVVWALGLVSFGAWWLSSYLVPRRRVLRRSPIVRIAILLLTITALATLLSSNRGLSFFGLYQRFDGLVSIVLYVGVGGMVAALYWRHPERLRELTIAIGAAAVVVTSYVLVQRYFGDPFGFRLVNGQVPPFPLGNLGNSEFTASYLGITMPFVIYLAISARSIPRRIAWAFAGLVVMVALWATQGRAGIVAAAAAVAAMGLFATRVRPIRTVLLVFVMLLSLSLLTVFAASRLQPTEGGILRTASVQYRSEMWSDAWRGFLHRPVLGWGPETYYGNYAQFRSALDARSQGLTIPQEPHNIYLAWAHSTGIGGLLTYLLVLATALWFVAERWLMLGRSRRLLAVAFGGGLVAYLVQGLFSIDVSALAFTGWIIVGGIAALADRRTRAWDESTVDAPEESSDRSSRKRDSWHRRQALVTGAVLAVLLFLVVAGFGPLRADHAAWAAERSPAQWSDRTMRLYEKAISLNPREASYRAAEAWYLEQVATDPDLPFSGVSALGRAASLYDKAISFQPRNELYILGAIRVYSRLGQYVHASYFPVAEKQVNRAVELDPLNPGLRDVYVDVLTRWSSKDASRREELTRRAEDQARIADQLRRGPTVPRQ